MDSLLQGEIAKRLGGKSNGRVFTELAIQTSMGVRVPDVSWGSEEYMQQHIREVFASSAPEICVEVISPSNTKEEMLGKVRFFIGAGAKEVWVVTEEGRVSYYDETGEISVSSYEVDLNKLI